MNDSCYLWPGLGGTERDYALVSASQAMFEFLLFPIATLLIETLPFTPLWLITFLLCTLGGLLYGSATDVWMAFAARGFQGMGLLLGVTVLNTYIGENGTYMDRIRERQQKRPMKHVIYIAVMLAVVVIQIALLG